MADHPMLFQGSMVRGLLREIEAPGTGKTNTRRLFKLPSWAEPDTLEIDDDGPYACASVSGCLAKIPMKINPGDRLWVREAWHAARSLDRTTPRDISPEADIEHAATARSYAEIGLKGKLRPGIHMPRWASRITLTVTGVKVERLQDISREDAIAEGLVRVPASATAVEMGCDWSFEGDTRHGSPVSAYALLWDHINGAGSWEENPWVVAYTFKPLLQNIDRVAA